METPPPLSPQMRARLAARAADRRAMLNVDPEPGAAAELELVRRAKALARLKTLVRAARADGAEPEDVLDALLSGDPELTPADAGELLDGGAELLRDARERGAFRD